MQILLELAGNHAMLVDAYAADLQRYSMRHLLT